MTKKLSMVIIRKEWQADVAIVDGQRCYAIEGSGKYGWCTVSSDPSKFFCQHLSILTNLILHKFFK